MPRRTPPQHPAAKHADWRVTLRSANTLTHPTALFAFKVQAPDVLKIKLIEIGMLAAFSMQ
jgi:hypothetical protein